ncbi:hypothetical protein AAFF_G00336690, partial [Aldrovandia affinis]
MRCVRGTVRAAVGNHASSPEEPGSGGNTLLPEGNWQVLAMQDRIQEMDKQLQELRTADVQ